MDGVVVVVVVVVEDSEERRPYLDPSLPVTRNFPNAEMSRTRLPPSKLAISSLPEIDFSKLLELPLTTTTMAVCQASSLFSLSDQCVRQFWTATVPAILAAAFCIFALPVPTPIKRILYIIRVPFTNFLPLSEAEALDIGEVLVYDEKSHTTIPRTLFISTLSLLESLVWLGIGSYVFALEPSVTWNNVPPFLLALSWLYASLHIMLKPTSTPPFDLFTLYTAHFILGILTIGGIMYDYYV